MSKFLSFNFYGTHASALGCDVIFQVSNEMRPEVEVTKRQIKGEYLLLFACIK